MPTCRHASVAAGRSSNSQGESHVESSDPRFAGRPPVSLRRSRPERDRPDRGGGGGGPPLAPSPAGSQLFIAGVADAQQTPNPQLRYTVYPRFVHENVGTASITVVHAGTAASTIYTESKDGTAKAGTGMDYTAVSRQQHGSQNPGWTTTVEVPINNDIMQEGEEYFILSVSGIDYRIQIIDDDMYTLSPTIFKEDVTTATITITYTGTGTGNPEFATKDGTAVAPGDYTSRSFTLSASITSGQSVNINIPIINDGTKEHDEHFFFNVSGKDHRITIEDDDVRFTVTSSNAVASTSNSFSFRENVGTARLVISNVGASTATPVFSTKDGTAKAGTGNDYTHAFPPLTPPASGHGVEIPINNDSTREGDEHFFLTVDGVDYRIIILANDGDCTELKREGAQLTYSLNRNPTSSSSHGSISGNAVTVSEAGSSNKVRIRLAIFWHPTGSNQAGAMIQRCSSTKQTVDYAFGTTGDTAEFGNDYTVEVLSGTSASPTTTALSQASGTITFQYGVNFIAYFDVTPRNDSVREGGRNVGGEEFFHFAISNPDGIDFSKGSGSQSTSDVNLTKTVTITDASPAPTLNLGSSEPFLLVGEGDTFDFTVSLDADPPTVEDVTVRCVTMDDTAIAGTHYTAVDETLTFSPGGEAMKTCSIPTIEDNLEEASAELRVRLADAAGGAEYSDATLNSPGLPLAIADDDDPPSASVAAASASISEGTATYSFEVNLDAPSGRTSVNLGYRFEGTAAFGSAAGSGVDYVVRGGTTNSQGAATTDGTGSLSIAGGETTAAIVIELQDDNDVELDESVVLVLDPTSTTASRLGINAASARTEVTIMDNDGKVLSVTAMGEGKGTGTREDPKRIAESAEDDRGNTVATWAEFMLELDVASSSVGQEATFRMRAAGPPGDTAVAGRDYSLADGDVTVQGGSLTGDILTLTVGTQTSATVRIPILDDNDSEGVETFAIVLEGQTGTSERATLYFAIEDNDGPDPILRELAKYSVARAEALLENQPRLIPMLRNSGRQDSDFSLSAVSGSVEFAEGSFRGETLWGAATFSRTVDGGEHEHFLATLGTHVLMSDRLRIGGMVQFDHSGMKPVGEHASGEIRGAGWMAGPYFAMRDGSHPLYFEGRLLYGRATSDVDALVIDGDAPRSASVDSERLLVQARVEGMYRFGGGGATLIPLADLSYARDAMGTFAASDDPQEMLEAQTIAIGKLQIGAEMEIPVATARGELRFRPGLRYVVSDANAGVWDHEEEGRIGLRSRGRIDFGIDYRLEDGLFLGFQSFYSGLGRKETESYGAGLDLRMEF